MHTLRTRFKKEIVAEFLPPAHPLRSQKKIKKRRPDRVIIFLSGMPGVPCQKYILEFYSKKGFWVFAPRYRGSWESSGRFLQKSPHLDVLDVISGLSTGFKDLWSGTVYKLKPDVIYLFASSFGGPAGILASRDPRVSKVVAFSPVVDWRAPSKNESLHKFSHFVVEAFGEAYRFSPKALVNLEKGNRYNPVAHVREIDGRKLYLIHAKDDTVVSARSVQKFAKQTGAKFLLLKKGGHFSLANFVQPRFYNRIKLFLR